jgi:hypothetical protein
MPKIDYRSGLNGFVVRAWVRWKKDAPSEEHHVASFAAGYNAACAELKQALESNDAKTTR